MKNTVVFLIVGILLFSCNSKKEPQKAKMTTSQMSIMAYYVPESNYQPENLPLDKLTHIIFSFTKVIDGEMKFRNEEMGKKLKALVAMRETYPKLKVMIACGGWGADGFSDAAASSETQEKFIKSVIDFNKEYQLDGLDMDWEYPGIPAAGTKARPEDRENFTVLMKGLREGLNTLERDQTLTFASAGWEPYYDNVDLSQVLKYVDYMNVMTYDQNGGGSKFTGHHTALGRVTLEDVKEMPTDSLIAAIEEQMEESDTTFEPQSAERIIEFCLKSGVPASKLVVGAAFYGRAWKGVGDLNNGLYQPNGGPHTGGIGYKDLRPDYEQNPKYKKYWDEKAKAPYLFSKQDSIFITYDDTTSVRLKTEFVKAQQLGGIMFWQLGHDVKEDGSLLDAIYTASK